MKISKEFKVGVFMVTGIAILYLGFNYLKGIDFFSTNKKYYAIYANIDGMNVSNPVMINGFTVGRVSKIRLLQAQEDQVLVEMDIRGEIVIGDSTIAVLNSDFLGNKSISLRVGDITKPLESGDTLIAQLDKGITDILAESAQPVANNLEATIKKINSILDQLGGSGGKIDSILSDFQSVSSELRPTIIQTRYRLDSTMKSYNLLAVNLNRKIDQLNPIMRNMKEITDSLKSLEMNATLVEANQTMKELQETLIYFRQENGSLGKLINEDSLYVNLNKTLESLDRLLIHFDTNPKHFMAPLGKSKKKIERDRRRQAKDGG